MLFLFLLLLLFGSQLTLLSILPEINVNGMIPRSRLDQDCSVCVFGEGGSDNISYTLKLGILK